MKLTIEISDDVLDEAKTLADREGMTLEALAESGFRQVLQSRRTSDAALLDVPARAARIDWDHVGDAFGIQDL